MLFVLEIDKVPSGESACVPLVQSCVRLPSHVRSLGVACSCGSGSTENVCFPRSLTQFGSERRQVQVAVLEVQLVVPCNDNTL